VWEGEVLHQWEKEGEGRVKMIWDPEREENEVYVNPHAGDDIGFGRSMEYPLATMKRALQIVPPGGKIYFYGKVREEGLVTPQGKTDVTVIGLGTRARGGNIGNALGPKRGAANWSRLQPDDDKPLLLVTQQGWRFVNIQFQGPVRGPAIHLIRNEAGEDSPEGFAGDHASFYDCAFVGPNQCGILHEGGINNVLVDGCTFYGFTSAGQVAIKGVAPTVGYPLFWMIQNNRFMANWMHIDGLLSDSIIRGNYFGGPSTIMEKHGPMLIDLRGGGFNWIGGNSFGIMQGEVAESGKWAENHYLDGRR
jgi:hypothetical protein